MHVTFCSQCVKLNGKIENIWNMYYNIQYDDSVVDCDDDDDAVAFTYECMKWSAICIGPSPSSSAYFVSISFETWNVMLYVWLSIRRYVCTYTTVWLHYHLYFNNNIWSEALTSGYWTRIESVIALLLYCDYTMLCAWVYSQSHTKSNVMKEWRKHFFSLTIVLNVKRAKDDDTHSHEHAHTIDEYHRTHVAHYLQFAWRVD